MNINGLFQTAAKQRNKENVWHTDFSFMQTLSLIR